MVLIVQACIGRQCLHEEPLDCLVGRPALQDPVPLEDATGIGINYEDRPSARIEQDTVRGFLPDPGDGEQPSARIVKVPAEHLFQVTPEIPAQHRKKGLQPSPLDPEIARWPYQLPQSLVLEAV